LKEGHAQPEALKWVDRPSIPSEAAKQLEMMKIFPWKEKKATRSRPILLLAGAISIAAFAAIFVLLFMVLRRSAPSFGALVLIAGAGFIAYLVRVFLRVYRRESS
jgi:hypothetical protein